MAGSKKSKLDIKDATGNIIASSTTSIINNDAEVSPSSSAFAILDLIRLSNMSDSSVSTDQIGWMTGIDKSTGHFDIRMRSISAGDGVALTVTDGNIQVSMDKGNLDSNSMVNYPVGGYPVYDKTENNTAYFNRLVAGNNIKITNSNGALTIAADLSTVSSVLGADNVGSAGYGVYSKTTSGILHFKKLVSGSNKLTLSTLNDNIYFTIEESKLNISNMTGDLPASRVSDLATIATTGSWNDLINKPFIPSKLNDLTDVDGTPTNGTYLRYTTGSGWGPSPADTHKAFSSFIFNSLQNNADSQDSSIVLETDLNLKVSRSSSGSYILSLSSTGIMEGEYLAPRLTVDAYGRITAIANGSVLQDPTVVKGDMLVRGETGVTRIASGGEGQVLTIDGGFPKWLPPAAAVSNVELLNGGGISIVNKNVTTDGKASAIVSLENTGATPGFYVAPSLRVDSYGRVISITNGNYISASRTVNAGAGLAGGGALENDVYLSLLPSGVTPGTYSNSTFTVNQYGQIIDVISGQTPLYDPTTSSGEMIFRNNDGLAKLVPGSNNSVLTISNGLPNWVQQVNSVNGLKGDVTVRLSTMSDVSTSGASLDQVLTFDGTIWKPKTPKSFVESVGLTGSQGISVTGSIVTSSGTFNVGLTNTGVAPGDYIFPQLTVDAQGRITAIESITVDPSIVVSTNSSATGQNSVVAASQNIINPEDFSVALGYGTGSPSSSNRTISLEGQLGNIKIAGTLTSSATFADFGEMFPNGTGKPIPLGTLLTLNGEYVIPAGPEDDIIGVVSATAGVVLGDSPMAWANMKQTGPHGEILRDSEGNSLLNPDFDPTKTYIPRSDRPNEWTIVGLVGQVYVNIDNTVKPNDYIYASKNHLGTFAFNKTNIRVLTITTPYDETMGYGVAKCLIK